LLTLQHLTKFISIFFFSVYLLSVTEAHQLLKLPVVFEHFAEHQLENEHIGFLEFLDMHYMHGNPQDDDYERDMQLPFKTTADCVSAVGFAPVPAQIEMNIQYGIILLEKKNYIIRDVFTHTAYLSNIWQPPQFC
jgi:hypothetical protein